MTHIAINVFLTLAVWAAYVGAWLAFTVWWRARQRRPAPMPAAVEWAQHELDEDSGPGVVLMVGLIFLATATLAAPFAASVWVWMRGGNDGCPEGQHPVEDGTTTAIYIKGVPYYVPNTICVLDNPR